MAKNILTALKPYVVMVNKTLFVPSKGIANTSYTRISKLLNNFLQALNICNLFFNLIFIRNPTPALVSDRYTFCTKCFNDISGDSVSMGDDPSQPQV